MKKPIALIAITAFAATAIGETLPFTYNFDDAEPTGYRKFKSKPSHDTETLDVAIFIDGSLAGKKVTSISVPVPGDLSVLTDFSAFITTELATRTQGADRYNNPDICSVEASLEGNLLKATFAEPYTITAEGVYVGYSLTDTSMEAEPIAEVKGYSEGAFWYRGSDANAKWTDMGKTRNTSSALTVYLEGTFEAYSVGLSDLDDTYVAVNEPAVAVASLKTFGSEPVSSISYTVTVDGKSETFDLSIAPEVAAKLGKPFTASLTLPAIESLGEYDFNVTIDKVNGQPNTCVKNSESAGLEVLKFVPKNNPLVEEYTGLNCGWCPRGYVTLRQMHDKYGLENFVAISYHIMMESGCMVHLDDYPYYPSGIPAAQVNRATSPSVESIPSAWSEQRKGIAPGEITVTLDWADDSKTEMVATAKARFLEDNQESPYRISFCVVADGLSNPAWLQNNAYSDPSVSGSGDFSGDYWDLFLGTEQYVSGLVYDDIAVLYPDQTGVKDSLPSQITSCEWYETSFRFKPNEIVNSYGEFVINDINKLRVIAIIHDSKAGSVVNSASSLYVDGTGGSGVEQIGIEEEEDSAPIYYNLNGQRVENPSDGIFIRFRNGRATKVIL